MSFNISDFEKFVDEQHELVKTAHEELTDKICSNITEWHKTHCINKEDNICANNFMKSVILCMAAKENTILHKAVKDMMRSKL